MLFVSAAVLDFVLAISSMACLPRNDEDLPLGDNKTRLDALLAIGIASLEQMQRIQDDAWLGASTDSEDEIDDAVLANLQLPTSTDSTLGGVDPPEDFASHGAMWGHITDSDDEIDDSVLANLQLPTSTDSTLGGVDPPKDFPSPGAMCRIIASPCTVPESHFLPSSGKPSRASPHTLPATQVEPVQMKPVGRDESDEGSGATVDRGRDSRTPAISCHDPIEATPAMWSGEGILDHDPIEATPAMWSGEDILDHDPIEATPAMPGRADVIISPTIPMLEVNDDGSKRRKLDRGTFDEAFHSGALLASQPLLEQCSGGCAACCRRGGWQWQRDMRCQVRYAFQPRAGV